MRFQVPQFVDIEDKIIGPFTLKQFLIYMVACMLLVPVYLITDISLFITLSLPVIAIAALFAHFKLNGKSLELVVLNAARFYSQGQLFLWRRSEIVDPIIIKDRAWQEEAAHPIEVSSDPSLDSMARALETQGKVVTEDIKDIYDENDK